MARNNDTIIKMSKRKYIFRISICYNQNMKISLKDIYYEFFMLGVQLLGGGYVIVPLMRKNLIEKKQWITEEELVEFYALSQSVPGVIAANISTFTGYKLRGKTGALTALLGILTSPVITVLIIAEILDKILNVPFIQSIFWGVGIAVIILIYLTIKEMWKHSLVDIPSYILFFIAFVLSFIFKISPVYIVILGIIYGITIQKMRGEK